MDEAHTVKVFTRLMWRGQERAAVRWMTERSSGGADVLDPCGVVQDNKTVLDLLKEKHPPPSLCNDRACVPVMICPPD